jgi:hypothetical protein
MVLRWVAAAFLITEENFCRIQDFRDLCILKAKLENKVALDFSQAAALFFWPATLKAFFLKQRLH